MLKRIPIAAALAMLAAMPALAQWTKLTPAVSPPASAMQGMAYDAGQSQVVLFGGMSQIDPVAMIGTWTWNGVTWTERYPGNDEYWRAEPGVAAFGNDVLLFGAGPPLNDTWKWSSNTWSQVALTGPPSAYMSVAASAFGNGVLAYEQTSNSKFQETWFWDGSWTQLACSDDAGYAGPKMSAGSSMAYDSIRHRAVLFGGLGLSETVNETWEWNGTAWTQMTPVHSPPARAYAAMVYDASAGVVVLFGGMGSAFGGGTVFNDTWTWDGTDWTQRGTLVSPAARVFPVMAYDVARGQVVLFGGATPKEDWSGVDFLGDTWVWVTPSYKATVQQPINPEGTSVFKANRGVIPIKFTLKYGGAPTCNLPPATIVVNRISSTGGSSVVNETEYLQNADSGSNFRIDPASCQYVYNLAASVLGAGTYRVDIVIANTVVGSATFKIA